MAHGYWLQHVYLQECRSIVQNRKYRGKITLADYEDDDLREILQDFISTGNEWHNVIPESAIEWLNDYVPELAGILEVDTLEKVRDVVRQSMLEGTTLQERIKALRESVPEIQNMAKHRIEAIARTEVTRADSMGRLIEMKNNDDVVGVEFSAVMDDRTTDICSSRHGLIMRMDDPRIPEMTPPLHVRCRSLLLSLTIYEFPDGVLTSHEFNDGELPVTKQREYDILQIQDLLDSVEGIKSATKAIQETGEIVENQAKTIKEANEHVVKQGIAKNANFGKLNIEAANEIIEGIKRAKDLFPELPIFDFVGSCQEHNRFIYELRCQKAFNIIKAKFPNSSDEEILKVVKAKYKKAKVKGDFWAFSYKEKGIRGIDLNEKFFSSKGIKEIHSSILHSVDVKFHPTGCITIKSIIDHEMGHQIDNLLSARDDLIIKKLYNNNHNDMKDLLSKYAQKNIGEFIAEAWSEYQNNSNPRPLAKQVAERLFEIQREKFKK